ncbi:hypothetical protein [Phytomonospora endophytica]|uniref:Uncharacterized protein n=1 Tax=Phytomonospora endophytica TaxID=714109 RepID=A0A841FUD2_9ACTN|nr:hypothetical protein [Phytomonospora endophytica]MBB6039965.1 hypothetical protein [Phytomonospora endophytica]GIG69829.1 hypothetical protein Pen01_61240 [Phytomonospora endophytica]
MTGAPVGGFGVPEAPRPPARLLGVAAAFVYTVAALAAVWAVMGLAGTTGLADALTADGAAGGRFTVQIWLTLLSASLTALLYAVATALAARALLGGGAMGYWWSIGLVAVNLAVTVYGVSTDGVQQQLVALTAETGSHSADLEHVVAALPGWYATYTVAHNTAAVLIGTIALVLLFLPASLEHTSRRPPPGTGGGGFEVPR